MLKKYLASAGSRRNSEIPTPSLRIVNDEHEFEHDNYAEPNNSPRRHSLPECLSGIKGLVLQSLDTIQEVIHAIYFLSIV